MTLAGYKYNSTRTCSPKPGGDVNICQKKQVKFKFSKSSNNNDI